MKTAIWILTLAGTIPVMILAVVLLVMHLIAAIIGTRSGHSDFIVSIARSDSSYLTSTHTLPLCFILAGGGLLLFGVWRLLQH
jgi:preprotein translocase subunit SecY